MAILFKHALDLAWNDGRLSRRGAVLLENLQDFLDLSDRERGVVEEKHSDEEVPFLIARGFGSGADLLDQWMATLLDLDEDLPLFLVSMGRSALKTGITKQGWMDAFGAAESMGCEFDFARGVWEPEYEVESLDWPDALKPVVMALGLMGEEE
ncbi:uncharacterized protein METZ01_LOCUS465325 [marine metagenome]|uniref:Uncharacterized protein n=1 Tax=marine metagenome TaxID=408172 RepID=A0A383AXW1_9ZZZZ